MKAAKKTQSQASYCPQQGLKAVIKIFLVVSLSLDEQS
jgi:hypothetical protein